MQDLATQQPEGTAPISSAGPTFAHPTFRDGGDITKRLDHLLPAPRSSSVDPLLLVTHGGRSKELRRLFFFSCGPSFPRPFSLGDTARGRFFAMSAVRTRSNSSLRWTHFHSFCVIDEEPSLHAFDSWAGSMCYEILEFRKHRKATDYCFGWFGQHRDPVGAQVAEESGPV